MKCLDQLDMNLQEQIEEYLASQPEPERSQMQLKNLKELLATLWRAKQTKQREEL